MFSILIAIYPLIIMNLLPVLSVFANVNTDKCTTCQRFTKVNKNQRIYKIKYITNVK